MKFETATRPSPHSSAPLSVLLSTEAIVDRLCLVSRSQNLVEVLERRCLVQYADVI
jgi:hypothetical protein